MYHQARRPLSPKKADPLPHSGAGGIPLTAFLTAVQRYSEARSAGSSPAQTRNVAPQPHDEDVTVIVSEPSYLDTSSRPSAPPSASSSKRVEQAGFQSIETDSATPRQRSAYEKALEGIKSKLLRGPQHLPQQQREEALRQKLNARRANADKYTFLSRQRDPKHASSTSIPTTRSNSALSRIGSCTSSAPPSHVMESTAAGPSLTVPDSTVAPNGSLEVEWSLSRSVSVCEARPISAVEAILPTRNPLSVSTLEKPVARNPSRVAVQAPQNLHSTSNSESEVVAGLDRDHRPKSPSPSICVSVGVQVSPAPRGPLPSTLSSSDASSSVCFDIDVPPTASTLIVGRDGKACDNIVATLAKPPRALHRSISASIPIDLTYFCSHSVHPSVGEATAEIRTLPTPRIRPKGELECVIDNIAHAAEMLALDRSASPFFGAQTTFVVPQSILSRLQGQLVMRCCFRKWRHRRMERIADRLLTTTQIKGTLCAMRQRAVMQRNVRLADQYWSIRILLRCLRRLRAAIPSLPQYQRAKRVCPTAVASSQTVLPPHLRDASGWCNNDLLAPTVSVVATQHTAATPTVAASSITPKERSSDPDMSYEEFDGMPLLIAADQQRHSNHRLLTRYWRKWSSFVSAALHHRTLLCVGEQWRQKRSLRWAWHKWMTASLRRRCRRLWNVNSQRGVENSPVVVTVARANNVQSSGTVQDSNNSPLRGMRLPAPPEARSPSRYFIPSAKVLGLMGEIPIGELSVISDTASHPPKVSADMWNPLSWVRPSPSLSRLPGS